MNGVIEAICRHFKTGNRIVGIEVYGRGMIVIHLADGSEHRHGSGARSFEQLEQRLDDAKKMFPDIPVYREGEAIPDWLSDLFASQARRLPARSKRTPPISN